MYLTGIGDEAGNPLETQLRAAQELGWTSLEIRNAQIEGFPNGNLHDLPDAAFDLAAEKLQAAGIGVCCFGSAIANWGKKIDQPFDSSLAEARRAIPRMQCLGTKYVRIMSFAVREDSEDQLEEERFRRLRELTRMFQEAGLQPVHENCMNYGGMGWSYALKLLENVPGLKWVFDTGNPLFNADRTKPQPWPRQDPWEFYLKVKPFVEHVHVKDAIWDPSKKEPTYTMPGEGHGRVKDILRDLIASGYQGGVSIEPHVAVVFHDASVTSSAEAQYRSFVDYGRQLEGMVAALRQECSAGR